jgi:hypothetical protein
LRKDIDFSAIWPINAILNTLLFIKIFDIDRILILLRPS